MSVAKEKSTQRELGSHNRSQGCLDEAVDVLREVMHRGGVDSLARQHLNRAIAHIREAWIARDGQKARTPAQLITDFADGEAMIAQIEAGADKVTIGKTVFKVHRP